MSQHISKNINGSTISYSVDSSISFKQRKSINVVLMSDEFFGPKITSKAVYSRDIDKIDGTDTIFTISLSVGVRDIESVYIKDSSNNIFQNFEVFFDSFENFTYCFHMLKLKDENTVLMRLYRLVPITKEGYESIDQEKALNFLGPQDRFLRTFKELKYIWFYCGKLDRN